MTDRSEDSVVEREDWKNVISLFDNYTPGSRSRCRGLHSRHWGTRATWLRSSNSVRSRRASHGRPWCSVEVLQTAKGMKGLGTARCGLRLLNVSVCWAGANRRRRSNSCKNFRLGSGYGVVWLPIIQVVGSANERSSPFQLLRDIENRGLEPAHRCQYNFV